MSWSTSELKVRLALLNRFKPSSKIFTDRSKAVLLLWIFYVFVLSCVCYVFVRVCLYVLCGNMLGKGWPLGSRLWCMLWVCHSPIGILGQVWYLIVSIPDRCTLTYFQCRREERLIHYFPFDLNELSMTNLYLRSLLWAHPFCWFGHMASYWCFLFYRGSLESLLHGNL